jgi:tRNA-Thr(GGU) m(6)t(6)A37 methyltransferase TsaA
MVVRMELKVIGTVRSAVRNRSQMPRLGAPACVELFPEYRDGLLRVEKHSHLWVLAWLDEAERDLLQVIPRGLGGAGPEALHGVFAVRSPARPNPIGLTAAKVLRVEGGTIEFDRLDFIDGTPVIDLKPYFVARDLVFSAANVQIGRPADREAAREALLAQAVNFHGEQCADLELGVELYTDFRAAVLDFTEPSRLKVIAPPDRPHLIDALMGMTRTSFGRGTFELGAGGQVRFEHGGGSTAYQLTAGGFARLGA